MSKNKLRKEIKDKLIREIRTETICIAMIISLAFREHKTGYTTGGPSVSCVISGFRGHKQEYL